MDAGTPASLWLLLDSSRSLLLLCQAFFPLTVSTFQSVMTPQLDVISNFFHAFETLLLSSLALCVFQFFPPTFFPKHFCTGTPVFMFNCLSSSNPLCCFSLQPLLLFTFIPHSTLAKPFSFHLHFLSLPNCWLVLLLPPLSFFSYII